MSGTLIRVPAEFAVCRLRPMEALPAWLARQGFLSITRTDDELSIICAAADVPADVRHESGWRVLKLQGPFAFTEVGVLLRLLQPLAAAGLGIMAVSTFDTDYVLVKSACLPQAEAALIAAGYTLRD
jgi:hypothetical protein